MAQLPRLVAIDLDGTLLNGQKQITPRTRDAVRALAAEGTICCLATGRMFRDCTAPHHAALGLDTPVICYNGAVIVEPSSGECLFEQPVAADLCTPVIEAAREQGLQLNLYHEDRLYAREDNGWAQLYTKRTGAVYHFRDDVYDFFAGKPSTKLLLLEEPGRVQELLPVWRERLGEQLYVTISDPEYLEFMDRGATKGWALRRLCEHFRLDPAETAAFGDALNDLPLIQTAGIGVAMANAREAVREAADIIAPSNDEDGVAQVIEGWLDGVAARP